MKRGISSTKTMVYILTTLILNQSYIVFVISDYTYEDTVQLKGNITRIITNHVPHSLHALTVVVATYVCHDSGTSFVSEAEYKVVYMYLYIAQ